MLEVKTRYTSSDGWYFVLYEKPPSQGWLLWAVALLQEFLVDYGYFLKHGDRATTVELREADSLTILPFLPSKCVPRADQRPLSGRYEDSPQAGANERVRQRRSCSCRHINFTVSKQRTSRLRPARKGVRDCCLERGQHPMDVPDSSDHLSEVPPSRKSWMTFLLIDLILCAQTSWHSICRN